ncbi:ABC transporter ATP-binding protein [Bradyrhizobium sp. 4]|uniref:ABC transporter ATP-binding protein n=1 Tax=unclassified Bradyrhizobium TaxID=2631580 RepID=UPI001FFBED9E|nr:MULTISPECIES: ABC transporter ATP-binding protein [unclassified Bradyrhizobium]MCK1396988.1 ABC transporter ATP-binding protein [Bradyrhizobium sp. 39]MCK1752264.1 ABC transporter ATP-binding protein [Bradyrhizobium sp. 135]UPJ36363.1 ABC transporter ATP-binding protein [Bradyrhizobium sp. 4]
MHGTKPAEHTRDTPLQAALQFQDLRKSYGSVVALDRVNLSIAPGEFLTLLGPSGSGKTTLLNVVSGMIVPTSGAVLIDGRDVTNIPPRERNIGMVFQNYALLPHMTVFENVAFPLRIRKRAKHEIERDVMAILDLVRLKDFAQRKPKELSGGQQQRVSIARCLVYKPKLILMDEPLGALDKKLRHQLQFEIRKIHQELGVTILYVTHDQEEALVLSDRICVMNHARIEQVGTPNDLYFRPTNEFVADFLGDANLIRGTIDHASDGVARVRTNDGSMMGCALQSNPGPGNQMKLMVRPEFVRLTRFTEPGDFGLRGVIENRAFVGHAIRYTVLAGDQRITVLQNSGSGIPVLESNDQVWVDWLPGDAISLL